MCIRDRHKTDKKGKAKILKLLFSENGEFSSLKSFPFLRIMNSEIETMITPTHDLIVKSSLIKISPEKAAINGERVSTDKVFLVPIVCNDFRYKVSPKPIPIIPLTKRINMFFNSVVELILIKAGVKTKKAIIFFIKLISIVLYF